MKSIKFFATMLIAIATCVGFTSCGDDDDDENDNSAIVGTWVGTFSEDYGGADIDEIITMTFTKDGKMTATGVDNTEPENNWAFSGTYITQTHESAAGNVLLISMAGYYAGDDEFYDDDVEFRPCTINGNVLEIHFDGSGYTLVKQ